MKGDLDRREVRVWRASVELFQQPDVTDWFRQILSEEEGCRMARFVTPALRHLYLVSHALVRIALSSVADVPPAAWQYQRNHWGAPYICAPLAAPALRFNLSHTQGMACCAMSLGREVGVDVEHLPRPGLSTEIAPRFFSPVEVKHLMSLSGETQDRRFAQIWTAKEAYIKARGMGLSIPLDSFSAEFPDDGEPRLATQEAEPGLGRWSLWCEAAGDDCYQAVAARHRPEEELFLTRYELLPADTPALIAKWK
jgi:4'-phosphopantetheinyl transferase